MVEIRRALLQNFSFQLINIETPYLKVECNHKKPKVHPNVSIYLSVVDVNSLNAIFSFVFHESPS